jgi:hypothetical protein
MQELRDTLRVLLADEIVVPGDKERVGVGQMAEPVVQIGQLVSLPTGLHWRYEQGTDDAPLSPHGQARSGTDPIALKTRLFPAISVLGRRARTGRLVGAAAIAAGQCDRRRHAVGGRPRSGGTDPSRPLAGISSIAPRPVFGPTCTLGKSPRWHQRVAVRACTP